VAELNEIKKKIEVTVALMQLINTRKKVLRTQKNQLEIAKMDLSLADEMGKATEIMKSMDSVNEKMTDIMLDAKEIQQNMEETNRLMKELAG
jgi:methyl-accepting chemotaxis protein